MNAEKEFYLEKGLYLRIPKPRFLVDRIPRAKRIVRRLRTPLLAGVLAACAGIAACNTSWIQTAEQYIAVLTPVAGEVLQILVLSGVAVPQGTQSHIAGYSQQATNDFQLVGTLLNDYNKANAVTTRQKINAALADAANNLNAMEQAAHVFNPQTQQKVNAAVQLAVSVVTQIEALIPQNAPASNATLARAASLPSPAALKQRFNAIFAH